MLEQTSNSISYNRYWFSSWNALIWSTKNSKPYLIAESNTTGSEWRSADCRSQWEGRVCLLRLVLESPRGIDLGEREGDEGWAGFLRRVLWVWMFQYGRQEPCGSRYSTRFKPHNPSILSIHLVLLYSRAVILKLLSFILFYFHNQPSKFTILLYVLSNQLF